MQRNSTAGIILAGGKSSRMGKDKALLSWRGLRLVDVVASVLKEAGIADVYVSGRIEGFINISDILADKGPVGGICACIQDLQSLYGRLLFVPVDMPLLSAACLRLLLDAESNRDACHYEDRPLPCMLQMNERTVRYAQHVQMELASGTAYSVKHFLAGLKAFALPVPTAIKDRLINTNTPQEWQGVSHESAHQ